MDAFNLYSQMERDDVLIAFKGSITSELLTSVLQIMETKMEDLHEAPRTRKKVFNVLVECLQNLYHHIDEFEVVGTPEEISEKKSAIFSISRSVESYNIVTGNFVSKDNVNNLTGKINTVSFLRNSLITVINSSYNLLILKNEAYFKFNFLLLNDVKIVTFFI